jgi:hypothetical protein
MSKQTIESNSLFLPRENIWVNSKLFKLVTEQDILESIPFGDINGKTEITSYDGALVDRKVRELTKLSRQDPIKNTPWDFIHFLDSDIFRPAAISFEESQKQVAGTNVAPSYTPHLEGTTPFKKFWKEELRRIRYGYEPIVNGQPCGIRISGEFYFYLNYCIIQKIEKNEKGEDIDEKAFPNFLLMDYYFFREVEARENPKVYNLPETYKKVGLTVAKARRKGFSFKAASGAVWVTAFPKRKGSEPKVIIASDTGSDAALCFKKAMVIIDWLTKYTPFGRKNPGDVKTNGGWRHITASMTDDSGRFTFGLENTRTKERVGRLSEIATISLANRDDKAAGEGVQRIYFEEAGKIQNIKKAWEFTRPTLKVGSMIRGIAIIFGTGGQMTKGDGSQGHSHGFSDLFNHPKGAGLAAFDNIHEYNEINQQCGWFVSDMWFDLEGWVSIEGKKYDSIDKNGNPYFWVAELNLNQKRYVKKHHGKKEEYDLFLTQHCKTPKEAFLVPEGNVFPVGDIYARESQITMGKLGFEGLRIPGELVETGGDIFWKPDLESKLEPIDTYIVDSLDKEGCLLRYEPPMKISGQIPEGAYIISVDPIGQNTVAGKSMTSVIVMKTPKYAHTFGPEKIVCTYRGRSKINPQGFVHQLLMKLSKYYNAKITFENDRDGGILQYFLRKGELGRLMSKPELTLSKYIPGSKTMLREYGHSMATSRHKRIGEDLLLEWLLKVHPGKKVLDQNNELVQLPALRNLDMLEDKAIIQELQAYNRKGNFDTVMALMGAIIQINEHFNEEFMEDGRSRASEVSSFWKDLYLDNWGSQEDKYRRNLEKAKEQNKHINWDL